MTFIFFIFTEARQNRYKPDVIHGLSKKKKSNEILYVKKKKLWFCGVAVVCLTRVREVPGSSPVGSRINFLLWGTTKNAIRGEDWLSSLNTIA